MKADMQIILPGSAIHAERPFAVEFVASADGVSLRITIEWRDIERLMGRPVVDERQVRDFLHRNRTAIRLAIQAHLAARGTPLDHELTMSAADFEHVTLVRPGSADASARARMH